MTNSSTALNLVNKITEYAINGVGPLCSANQLAAEYAKDPSFFTNTARVDSLINWEISKNFTSGFINGLTGIINFPASIAGSLGASWVIQARMAAAIAVLAGHNVHEDRVKSLVLMSLLGDSLKDLAKELVINLSTRINAKIIQKLPGTIFIEINKKIGFRLITKAGEKGLINLTRMIPLIGGPISGGMDAAACAGVGRAAKEIFLYD